MDYRVHVVHKIKSISTTQSCFNEESVIYYLFSQMFIKQSIAVQSLLVHHRVLFASQMSGVELLHIIYKLGR